MSNIKNFRITGHLPFDLGENRALFDLLGVTLRPSVNMKLCWYQDWYVPNSRGGKTCMYEFELIGREALQSRYFEELRKEVERAGGQVYTMYVRDEENNCLLVKFKNTELKETRNGQNEGPLFTVGRSVAYA